MRKKNTSFRRAVQWYNKYVFQSTQQLIVCVIARAVTNCRVSSRSEIALKKKIKKYVCQFRRREKQ